MSRKFDDNELKAFLQKNQPIAPPAERGQLEQLLAKLGLQKKERSTSSLWLGLSSAVAASVLAVFMFFGTTQQQPAINEEIAFEEDYFEEEELPALEVGDDYFELVATADY